MKIRTGFVSNSSTSSFIIIGFCLDYENKIKLYKEGSGGSFDIIEGDNIYIGKKIWYDEGFYSNNYIKKSEFDDKKVVNAAKFLNKASDEAEVIIGEFDR